MWRLHFADEVVLLQSALNAVSVLLLSPVPLL
jgi:hypothetical protein